MNRRFVIESDRNSPEFVGNIDVERFLSQLTVQRRASASTQSQALATLLFLFPDVLERFYLDRNYGGVKLLVRTSGEVSWG